MKQIVSLALLVLIANAVPAICQSNISEPGAKRICSEVKDVEFPAGDLPTPEEKAALSDCVSLDLYYGFGRPADPVEARKCAYVEMERADNSLPFAGKAMLAMIYANGKGVPRNFDLAIKLQCELDGAPNDIAGNVHQLARLRQFHHLQSQLGKILYEQCAILQDRHKPERDRKVDAMAARWNARDRKKFQTLRQAANDFFKIRATLEVNLQATHEVQEIAFLGK